MGAEKKPPLAGGGLHATGLANSEAQGHCTAARLLPHLLDREPPARIRDLTAWVIWRFEERDKKPDKVPFYAAGSRRRGEQGGSQDVAQLVTFDAAREAAIRRGFDGVGFCTLPRWGICAVDVDRCIRGRLPTR